MSKSVLYGVNSTSQTVANDGTINFGNIVRRYGCNLDMSGGSVVAKGSGYYRVDSNFTIIGSGTGTDTITFYKDGVAIPGTTATISVGENYRYQVSIPFIFRQTCCCDTTITAVLTGATATITNASIVAEKE